MLPLARSLLDDPLGQSELERRASPRYPVTLQASFRPLTGTTGIYWDAAVQDLSAGGVCLRTQRQFPLGTVLIVKLHKRQLTTSTVVRVVHVKKLADDQCVLGGIFATKLSNAELASLLSEKSQ